MTSDTTPLEEWHCLRLLAKSSIGRVVYTVGALPAVLPVRYRLDDDGSVLFRTAAGSEFLRAVADALVAFQADEVNDVGGTSGSGWSVTVLGRAEVAPRSRPPEDGSRAPAADQITVRIRPEWVTGRLLPDLPHPPP
ncbi:pyridoxamine 5'-phosphate oxidase family protein [Kitasatospora cinereorecta]|uniref:Pyridoxamine 5'-phosphate oxidase family protein n=1 Tax=Kitasatospora cinereorecta TaxID=285560 RepID=A0ABW0V2P2_9ACTN